MRTPTIYINAPNYSFLMPYFEREFQGYTLVADPPAVNIDGAVMISPILTGDLAAQQRREDAFSDICRQKGVAPCILRVPHVVATGMTGFPMRLAQGISRGTLMHIKGNEAVTSLIHGVDVAAYATALMGTEVTVDITDGTVTSVDALIDALARRINDKKVFSIAPRWAKLLYGNEFYTQMTTSFEVFDSQARSLAPQVNLHPVTEYLTTHVYDDESL